MSIEALLEANTAAVKRNSDLLERVIAGQEAAMAKLEGGKATTTRTPRAKKEEAAPAAAAEPVAETPAAAEPETKSFLPAIKVGDTDGFKGVIMPWLGAVQKGTPEAAERVGFLKALADHLGVDAKNFFGPVAADADKLKEALFLFKRKEAGIEVNFAADYNLDGDPTQDVAAGETSDDDFG